MLRFFVLGAFLAIATSLSAQSCETTTAELTAAIDAVHEVRDASRSDAAKVVDEWQPRVVIALARVGEIEDSWLHLGVDIARELVRLGRVDEARRLLSQVSSRESDSSWRKQAKEELEKLG